MDNKKRVWIYLLSGVLGLAVIYYLASFVVPRVLVTLTKASPAEEVSLSNSYVLGSKMVASADGRDKCVVNVFILDKNGKGIPGQRVELSGVENIMAINEMTDNNGQASFEMTSMSEGQYKIEAMVEGVPTGKSVTVTFRN